MCYASKGKDCAKFQIVESTQIVSFILNVFLDEVWIPWFTMRSTSSKYNFLLKFMYSEKAKKFCKIFALLLTGITKDKSKVNISHNFVAFSEYMNFMHLHVLRYFYETSHWLKKVSRPCKCIKSSIINKLEDYQALQA